MNSLPVAAQGVAVARGEFGLVPDALAALRDLCARTDGIDRVWVFGSRARDDWRPRSDLDLAVDAPDWKVSRLLDFQVAVRNLPIVYRVDVVHWQQAPAELRQQIERDRKVLWARPRS